MKSEEATAYAKVLLCIAKADGVISESELKYIKSIAKIKEFDSVDIDKTASEIESMEPHIESLLEQISCETGKDLLKSILVLGYADGNYSDPEKRAYTFISGYFDMRKAEVQNIEKEAIGTEVSSIEDASFRESLNKIDNVIDENAGEIAKDWLGNIESSDKDTLFGCSIDELISAWNR